MKTKIIIMVVIAVGLAAGLMLGDLTQTIQRPKSTPGHHNIYYCPMHPWVKSDKPGTCPICFMQLVKKQGNQESELQQMAGSKVKQQANSLVEGYASITVPAQKQQVIGLHTQGVEVKPVVKIIRTFGTIASDDELYKTQGEFIDAFVAYVNVFRDYKRIQDRLHIWESHRDLQIRLLEAKDKLLQLGLSQEEIGQLQSASWNQVWKQPKLLLFNDSRNYWVLAQIFEQDYSFVHEGQKVQVSIPALQETIKGVIRSVGGFIDPTNRSVTALIELSHYGRKLAANMLVDITIPVELGNAILVPRQAVMDTGLRKIVFVSGAADTFQPREIQTSWETDEGFAVKSGLKEGERIVLGGNFLLDSESRVQAGLSEGVGND